MDLEECRKSDLAVDESVDVNRGLIYLISIFWLDVAHQFGWHAGRLLCDRDAAGVGR
jgi:hypothetical protein